jgi:pantetheine-phosphate adenylyltransferase
MKNAEETVPMSKIIAVYPGSFDPVTYGHMDIIRRGARLFDTVIVSLVNNPNKKYLFSIDERLDMLNNCFKDADNISFDHFDGLLVEYVEKKKANMVVRGIRAITDFEFEMQMALMNRRLSDKFETVFLMPREEHVYVSSRLVKEIARLRGDVSGMVHPYVNECLLKRFER